jgi:hypothetical protein
MARRNPPRKVTYFEPVPPRLARNIIIESTFDVGRRVWDNGFGLELHRRPLGIPTGVHGRRRPSHVATVDRPTRMRV